MATRPSTLRVALAGASLCVLLAGCSEAENLRDELGQAGEGLNRVQVCAEALGLADFNPQVPTAEEAAQAARDRIDELERLATETTDADVAQGLRDMAASLESVANTEISAEDVEGWAQQQADRLAELQEICT
ncbi:hypothetical protein FHR81_005243 [Actinoalloteichus hoggarensis]|uniref:Uncharacterized protein n=1 Tax=Actinoalloteichus hoggarensis TaxID=1470176 RepID=A0A221WAH1_9PSEU|nr:bacteriophage spanin2 family protein [Actinoalloteichus hoggarensis]ASO22691.1 hypothetical protein AHOG_25430 [Actinoalloteichus hoggarensis]MBB5924166.1 hypothetical protein [Actinoalloteichus hoggarensis]